MGRPTLKQQTQNLHEVIKTTAWQEITDKGTSPYPCVPLPRLEDNGPCHLQLLSPPR